MQPDFCEALLISAGVVRESVSYSSWESNSDSIRRTTLRREVVTFPGVPARHENVTFWPGSRSFRETERESAGFGPEWGGRRSGGSIFWDVVGEAGEAEIPLETGGDAGRGGVDGLALRMDGERVRNWMSSGGAGSRTRVRKGSAQSVYMRSR